MSKGWRQKAKGKGQMEMKSAVMCCEWIEQMGWVGKLGDIGMVFPEKLIFILQKHSGRNESQCYEVEFLSETLPTNQLQFNLAYYCT